MTIILLALVTLMLFIGNKKTDLDEVIDLLKRTSEEQRNAISDQINNGTKLQFERFSDYQNKIQETLLTSSINSSQSLDKTLQSSRRETNEELAKFSERLDSRLSGNWEQTLKTLRESQESINKQLLDFGKQLDDRLSSFQRSNADNNEGLRNKLDEKMKSLQEGNEKKLNEIQGVVDEKLQTSLEKKFNEKFSMVGENLDKVQQGLGEMKTLAKDAQDLKIALTNVKTRGGFGEVFLEKMLSDILDKRQFDKQVAMRNGEKVDFVIKLPGKGVEPLLLPIDAKFSIEAYKRIREPGDAKVIDEARKALAKTIRDQAKDISEKYIDPPVTTNFALMYLPTEGLYAEVLDYADKKITLVEELWDKYKITVVGPTTLSAFLNSLLIGFRTLAIEQQALEVEKTLQAVKSEYTSFGGMIKIARKHINDAGKKLDTVSMKVENALNVTFVNLETLPEHGNSLLLEPTESECGE